MIKFKEWITNLLSSSRKEEYKPRFYIEQFCGRRWLMADGIAIRDLTQDLETYDNYVLLQATKVHDNYTTLKREYYKNLSAK